MRLFTAIELTDEAREAIGAEQRAIAAGLGTASRSLRWISPDRMHLTLVFIGETPAPRTADIVRVLRPDVPIAPFHLSFGGIGTFPPRGAPRVLWLAVQDGVEAAVELHAQVAGRLEKVGISPDERPFRPHLTMARYRPAAGRSRPARSESAHVVARMSVERVTLFQSRLSPAGPTYTALAHASLRCL